MNPLKSSIQTSPSSSPVIKGKRKKHVDDDNHTAPPNEAPRTTSAKVGNVAETVDMEEFQEVRRKFQETERTLRIEKNIGASLHEAYAEIQAEKREVESKLGDLQEENEKLNGDLADVKGAVELNVRRAVAFFLEVT
ncbi:hypothetical protein JAAARDRAFT_200469 [Jaapia argillacea MUCL 33604]|uniref:Uncharacterized protein n=1 Tax=Jaapia argillacea MUCL 33604 TaxID=933084 RepID=A0A067PFW1_9AGAM|nr:hypothetical protein JAAARDRAFT_200469 [Jaapia argillacea MUCL 33604]